MQTLIILEQLYNLPSPAEKASVERLLGNLKPLVDTKFYQAVLECITYKHGWVFAGADFSSLEDRINALLTKDTNKLKVYTDGYDGHALRAYAYFKSSMPTICQLPLNTQCFKASIEGKTVFFTEHDTIHYQGNSYKGVEFYELCAS